MSKFKVIDKHKQNQQLSCSCKDIP